MPASIAMMVYLPGAGYGAHAFLDHDFFWEIFKLTATYAAGDDGVEPAHFNLPGHTSSVDQSHQRSSE